MKKLFKKNSLSFAYLLSALLLATSINAPAQSAGSLDTSFNHTGKITTSIATYDQAWGVAIQSDQKIVAVGSSAAGSNYSSVAVVRYNVDGTLDNTFGTEGKTTTYLGDEYFGSWAQAAAIQPDGKIVAAGSSAGGDGLFTIIRYNTNGIIDSTFGNAGIVTNPQSAFAYAVAIQADGKIVVAGNYNNQFGLVRYFTNGIADSTFGTGVFPFQGIVTTTIFSSSMSVPYAVSIQSDQKIVAAGYSQNGSTTDFTLVRYNTDGSIDSSFGNAGIVTTAFGINATAYGLSIQSDKKIIAVGSSGSGAGALFALARYDTTGSLDTSFGTGGTLTTSVGSGGGYALGVSIQQNGDIVAAGFAGYYFALARYADNGTLDASFGTGGTVTTPIAGGGKNAQANSIALQANGKIVLAGYSEVNINAYQFALARYNATDSLTGIPDYDMGSPVNIYPNPAHDRIYITSRQNIAETAILDMMGREIQVCKYEDALHVSIMLPAQEGVYLVRIKTKEGMTVRKVVKGM